MPRKKTFRDKRDAYPRWYKIGLMQRLEFLFTGKITLPKPKRKAKKRVSVDASKGRKRIPKPKKGG